MDQSLDIGYKYQPLDPDLQEIRILWVQNTLNRSALRCRLEHISLAKQPLPSYIGISYVWGDLNRRKAAVINEQEVSVPETVHLTLRGCMKDRPRYNLKALQDIIKQKLFKTEWLPFWIDAVCINQSDLQERSYQVELMRKIYTSAYAVYVWLGEDNDGKAGRTLKIVERFDYLVSRGDEDVEYKFAGSLSDKDLDALDSLYSCAWFTGTWTLQEAILPKRVICRRGVYSWDWKFVSWLAGMLVGGEDEGIVGNTSFSSEGWDGCQKAARFFIIERNRTLSDLLTTTQGFRSTDPRDKVYALLGLVEAGIPTDITIDYERPIRQLCIKTSRAAIREDLNLAILTDAFCRSQASVPGTQKKLPSWVLPCHWQRINSVLCASHAFEVPDEFATHFEYVDAEHEHILRVKGLILDTVESKPVVVLAGKEQGQDSRWKANSLSVFNILERLEEFCSEASKVSSQIEEKELKCLLGKALQAEEAEVDEYNKLIPTACEELFDLQQAIRGLTDSEREKVLTDFAETHRLILYTMFIWQRGRPIATTAKRRLCNLWPTTRKGDKICLLFGCDHLLTLRPVEDHWLLIGDAYIPGGMKGEGLIEMRDKGEFEANVQYFDIH